jgi:hypothetical protein
MYGPKSSTRRLCRRLFCSNIENYHVKGPQKTRFRQKGYFWWLHACVGLPRFLQDHQLTAATRLAVAIYFFENMFINWPFTLHNGSSKLKDIIFLFANTHIRLEIFSETEFFSRVLFDGNRKKKTPNWILEKGDRISNYLCFFFCCSSFLAKLLLYAFAKPSPSSSVGIKESFHGKNGFWLDGVLAFLPFFFAMLMETCCVTD